MSKIYKGHNSKITSIPCNQLALCNCRVKEECPIDGKFQTMDEVYDCRVTSSEPQKIYFGLAEGKRVFCVFLKNWSLLPIQDNTNF